MGIGSSDTEGESVFSPVFKEKYKLSHNQQAMDETCPIDGTPLVYENMHGDDSLQCLACRCDYTHCVTEREFKYVAKTYVTKQQAKILKIKIEKLNPLERIVEAAQQNKII